MNQEQHLQNLLNTKRRRLEILEQQAARYGNECSPHIILEIEDLRREIEAINFPIHRCSVVMLGSSNSGKEAFLASMFYKLSIQREDASYFLQADERASRILTRTIAELITSGDWPIRTQAVEVPDWHFMCFVQTEKLRAYPAIHFTFMDYTGIRAEDAQHSADELAKFHQTIQNADALLVFLDGNRIYQFMSDEEPEYNLFFVELLDLVETIQNTMNPIEFVITKWDIIDGRYTLKELRNRLFEFGFFYDLVTSRKVNNTQIRLIPISSVGMKFSTALPNGTIKKIPGAILEPFQVDVPLACILIDRLGFNSKEFGSNTATSAFTFDILDLKTAINQDNSFERTQRLNAQRDISLRAVQDEPTAYNHVINSFMYIVSKLEHDFPESNLSLGPRLWK